jgi:hypothetical protein
MREFADPEISRKLQSTDRLIQVDRRILGLGHHSHTAQS